MSFDSFLDSAWNDHGDHPRAVADRLAASVAVVAAPEQVAPFARLVTHVYGEHLGEWAAGIALLESLRGMAGVGGDVPSLLKLALSVRPIIALDGCPLACVQNTLRRHGIAPDQHHQLQIYGVRKHKHQDFDPEQAEAVLYRVRRDLRLMAEAPQGEAAAP